MSYCRFSEGDVYMFYHCGGFIECCSCSLAPLVNTIWTKGHKKGSLFEECDQCQGSGCEHCWCKHCQGQGCKSCMMHGSLSFETFEEAIEHLKEHQKNGDDFPSDVFDMLEEDIRTEGRPKKVVCNDDEVDEENE